METDSVQKLLNERQKTHGDWGDYSIVSQDLKRISCLNCGQRTPDQNEAIDMICGKLARIIVGDADFADHWDDIKGYAQLGKNGHRPEQRKTARAVPGQTIVEAYTELRPILHEKQTDANVEEDYANYKKENNIEDSNV